MNSNIRAGFVSVKSNHSVDDTVRNIEELLAARGVGLFAVIDHSGEAEKAGLSMPPTRVVIFGSPKAGTPLMLASPSTAIDLPLKLLIAEGAEAVVTVTWNSPEYFVQRHGLPDALLANIAAISALAHQAAE